MILKHLSQLDIRTVLQVLWCIKTNSYIISLDNYINKYYVIPKYIHKSNFSLTKIQLIQPDAFWSYDDIVNSTVKNVIF